MDELEVTREVYEQLRGKLKLWQQEKRDLLRRLEQQTRKERGTPTQPSRQTVANLEHVTLRISQIEDRLQRVHIIDQQHAREYPHGPDHA